MIVRREVQFQLSMIGWFSHDCEAERTISLRVSINNRPTLNVKKFNHVVNSSMHRRGEGC